MIIFYIIMAVNVIGWAVFLFVVLQSRNDNWLAQRRQKRAHALQMKEHEITRNADNMWHTSTVTIIRMPTESEKEDNMEDFQEFHKRYQDYLDGKISYQDLHGLNGKKDSN